MNGGSAFGFGGFGGTPASAPAQPSWGAAAGPSTLEVSPLIKQPSSQISTLEVFGEDNDSRKKRFETSLHDNRYIQVSSP